MKHILILCLVAATALAETESERQLKELQDQRQKALATAAEPVNRRFQATLEQLLKHATVVNDLPAAVKIKAEIDSIIAVSRPAAEFTEGSWVLKTDGGYSGPRVFRADGTVTTENGKGQWRVEGLQLIINRTDHFELPIQDGKLRGKNVTTGEGLTLIKLK